MSRRILLPSALAFAASLATPASGGTVNLSGTVYDGNGGPLLKGNVYHVLATLDIPAGQTLSVEEGVVVKFEPGCGITVNGVLDCQGTDLERIAFTSIRDDNVGGDTNQDGSATQPAPDDWKGLFFGDGSDGSIVSYSDILWAGTATNSGAIELHFSDLTLDHLRFADCGWTALNLDESNVNNVAFVSHCEIARCHRPLGGVSLDSLKRIDDVTAVDCTAGDYAAMIGNDGAFHEDADLSPSNLVNGVLFGGFFVMDGVTVTLHAGCIVKLGVGSPFNSVGVAGTLELLGTAGAPVVFTSIHDDTFGGDTEKDGAATSPASGDWGGLAVGDLFAANETLTAEHVVVRYAAGLQASLDLAGRKAATLRDCVVEKGSKHGIRLGATTGSLAIERCASNDHSGIAWYEAVLPNLPAMLDVTASGNGTGDYLQIGVSSLNTSASVEFGPRNYPGAALVTSTGFDFPSGRTLTLLPGTVVKFEVGKFSRWSANQGAFQWVGTPEQPIVLTSLRDDAVGGDTNHDGATTSAAPGDWDGVTLAPNSDPSALEHVRLRYGGASAAQVVARAAQSSVRSVRSEFSKSAAFFADAHSGAARNWIAFASQKNGIEVAGGSFDLLGATVADNAGFGIKRTNPWSGRVVSSIVWNNAGGNFSGFAGTEVFFSDGGFSGSNGNLDVDPLFVDPAQRDYSLQAASPCIESGDPADASAGTDAAGLPRVLDRDFDKVLRVDMGAYEAGHVVLALAGDFTPGGAVSITSSGTPGLPALMLIGVATGDVLVKPFGRLFLDLSQPWLLLPWPASPVTVNGTLPASLPVPFDIYFQEAVLSNGSGNLSNLGRMHLE